MTMPSLTPQVTIKPTPSSASIKSLPTRTTSVKRQVGYYAVTDVVVIYGMVGVYSVVANRND